MCTNETKCSKCIENKYLLNGKCLDKCPINFYGKSSTCLSCYPSCQSCTGPTKLECLTCNSGFIYSKKECRSECPEGTYFDIDQNECKLCNESNCKWCIKSPNMCTRCESSLALDLVTFTCQPCCTRSIRGKIKYPTCCNCPTYNFNGNCLLANQTEDTSSVIIHFIKDNKSSFLLNGVSFILVLLSIGLFLYSLYLIGKNFKKTSKQYDSVQYSTLLEHEETAGDANLIE